MRKDGICNFESSFEIILDFENWEDLFNHHLKLDLFQRIKEHDLYSPLGTVKIDTTPLIFLFFNAEKSEIKMEKKLINIFDKSKEVIGVLELAIAVSSIL